MRRRIELNHAELEGLADKTEGLSRWLDDKATQVVCHSMLPTALMVVTSIAIKGAVFLVDGSVPDSVCWAGCSYTT